MSGKYGKGSDPRDHFIKSIKFKYPILAQPLDEITGTLQILRFLNSSYSSFLEAIQEISKNVNSHSISDERIELIRKRIENNMTRFLKSILISDLDNCNLLARELLELEAILLSFNIDNSNIEAWEKSTGIFKNNFSYGSLEIYIKQAAGIPKSYARPDWSEYSIHSEISHPGFKSLSYRSKKFEINLELILVDYIQHVRNCGVLLSNLLGFDAMFSKANQIIDEHADNLSKMQAHLESIGMIFPDRESYEISKFPNGIEIVSTSE